MLFATMLFLSPSTVRSAPPLGSLFVAQTSFPTDAEDDKDLIRKGRKHRSLTLRMAAGGDAIQCHILLVLKNKFQGKQIYFVLYPAGSKDYAAATPVSVRRGTKRLISPMNFAGSFERGKKYTLRATWPRQRGKQVIETVLGSTTFTLN
jgi:hypothetical protein